jgi:hypothetical protein
VNSREVSVAIVAKQIHRCGTPDSETFGTIACMSVLQFLLSGHPSRNVGLGDNLTIGVE